MYQKECAVCGVIIHGFSKQDVKWKFTMHMLSHRKQIQLNQTKEKKNGI